MFIVRDDQENFLTARNSRITGVFSPRVAGALAMKKALSWVRGRNWLNVVYEGDSLEVIQALEGYWG